MNGSYGIIGFASDIGATVHGSSIGPQTLRERKLVEVLKGVSSDVVDYGDVRSPFPVASASFTAAEKEIHDLDLVYAASRALNERVAHVIREGRTPIVLGGDHSLSIGSISAVASAASARGERIGVIWVDAHSDINTPATSPSKRLFGMPLAFLGGLVPGAFASLATPSPAFSLENLAFIGLRDVDPGEREIIRNNRISAFSMRDVDMRGIGAVVTDAIRVACKDTAGFVLSFDLDACDPLLAPGTGTPYRGGLTFRESHLLMELIAESQRMLALELVEFNPSLDKNGQTAEIAISLLETALGKTIL